MKNHILIYLILFAFLFRFVVSFTSSFEFDESAYRFWSKRLVEQGFSHFYAKEVFTNNPLGGLYAFWLMGTVKKYLLPNINYLSPNFDFLLKIPANLADIISAYFIYKILKQKLSLKLAYLGFVLYIFNPAIFFNSSVWGQYDGLATLFLIISTYAMLIKKIPELSLAAFATAWTVKPQAIAFAPILLLLIIFTYKPWQWLSSAVTFFLTALIIYLPFFPSNPIKGLIYVNQDSANLFNCTTCFAFNFWGIFGNWQNDLQKFLEIPIFIWGIILFSSTLGIIFFSKPLSQKLKPPYFYLAAAISIMAFFTLLTRMHERYLFVFFPFLLLGSIMLKSKTLIGFYIFMSCLHLLNLYLPYAYYNNLAKITNLPVNNLINNFQNFSLISFLGFILLFIHYLYYVNKTSPA